MPAITLANTPVTLEGREGESLAATLLRAGFMMRLACQSGGCGLCPVHVERGTTVYDAAVAESALAVIGYHSGVVLACRAVPVGDVTISVPPEGRLRCVAPLVTPFALHQPEGRPAGQPLDGVVRDA